MNASHQVNTRSAPILAQAQVIDIQDVAPFLRRFTVKADEFVNATGIQPGGHFKVFIPLPGQSKAVMPSLNNGRPSWSDVTDQPAVRTYTVRHFNAQAGELQIEFVLHGDNGPASAWAERAQLGDYVGIGVKAKKPFPAVDWYLFAGDETAIPAITAFLELLPPQAEGVAYLEVDTLADKLTIDSKTAIKIQWLFRNGIHAEASNGLIKAVQSTILPDEGTKLVWAAGEATVIKPIRDYAKEVWQLQREELHATAYWRAGFSEDQIER